MKKQKEDSPQSTLLSTSILQEIIDFVEKRYEESSHTYLDTYRASRQTSKEIRDYIKNIAKRNKIPIKTKNLKCHNL